MLNEPSAVRRYFSYGAPRGHVKSRGVAKPRKFYCRQKIKKILLILLCLHPSKASVFSHHQCLLYSCIYSECRSSWKMCGFKEKIFPLKMLRSIVLKHAPLFLGGQTTDVCRTNIVSSCGVALDQERRVKVSYS